MIATNRPTFSGMHLSTWLTGWLSTHSRPRGLGMPAATADIVGRGATVVNWLVVVQSVGGRNMVPLSRELRFLMALSCPVVVTRRWTVLNWACGPVSFIGTLVNTIVILPLFPGVFGGWADIGITACIKVRLGSTGLWFRRNLWHLPATVVRTMLPMALLTLAPTCPILVRLFLVYVYCWRGLGRLSSRLLARVSALLTCRAFMTVVVVPITVLPGEFKLLVRRPSSFSGPWIALTRVLDRILIASGGCRGPYRCVLLTRMLGDLLSSTLTMLAFDNLLITVRRTPPRTVNRPLVRFLTSYTLYSGCRTLKWRENSCLVRVCSRLGLLGRGIVARWMRHLSEKRALLRYAGCLRPSGILWTIRWQWGNWLSWSVMRVISLEHLGGVLLKTSRDLTRTGRPLCLSIMKALLKMSSSLMLSRSGWAVWLAYSRYRSLLGSLKRVWAGGCVYP